jgi:ribonuclease Z
MGVVTILRSLLYPPRPSTNTDIVPKKPVLVIHVRLETISLTKSLQPTVELYGPAGLRAFVRTILQMTSTRTSDHYVVHELLTPVDLKTPCEPLEIMHSSEHVGRDIQCDEDGFWRTFTKSEMGDVVVDAGPIEHRGICVLTICLTSNDLDVRPMHSLHNPRTLLSKSQTRHLRRYIQSFLHHPACHMPIAVTPHP